MLLSASACNFTKSNTPPWAFPKFFKLYKWYQIDQSITYKYFLWASLFSCLGSVVLKTGSKYACNMFISKHIKLCVGQYWFFLFYTNRIYCFFRAVWCKCSWWINQEAYYGRMVVILNWPVSFRMLTATFKYLSIKQTMFCIKNFIKVPFKKYLTSISPLFDQPTSLNAIISPRTVQNKQQKL